MFHTKKEIYRFLSRIYKFASTNPDSIRIQKIRRERDSDGELCDIAGLCFADEADIVIDYRHDVVFSILHECIHLFWPAFSEKKVLALEARLTAKITRVQAMHILEMLSVYATTKGCRKQINPKNFVWNGKRMVPKETKKKKKRPGKTRKPQTGI